MIFLYWAWHTKNSMCMFVNMFCSKPCSVASWYLSNNRWRLNVEGCCFLLVLSLKFSPFPSFPCPPSLLPGLKKICLSWMIRITRNMALSQINVSSDAVIIVPIFVIHKCKFFRFFFILDLCFTFSLEFLGFWCLMVCKKMFFLYVYVFHLSLFFFFNFNKYIYF